MMCARTDLIGRVSCAMDERAQNTCDRTIACLRHASLFTDQTRAQ